MADLYAAVARKSERERDSRIVAKCTVTSKFGVVPPIYSGGYLDEDEEKRKRKAKRKRESQR